MLILAARFMAGVGIIRYIVFTPVCARVLCILIFYICTYMFMPVNKSINY